jgi:hypothetical protein
MANLLRVLLGVSVLGLGGVAQAVPVVIDFGAGGLLAPPTYSPQYIEDGFRFSTIDQVQPGVEQDHFDILDLATHPAAGPEREAVIHTGNDADEVIVDFFGAAFALLSMEIEVFDPPDPGAWEIEASNGTKLTFSGTGTVNFDSNWSNITSFTMRSTKAPNVNDFSGELYFDDIRLDTDVPEPAAAALLAASAAAALLRRHRH